MNKMDLNNKFYSSNIHDEFLEIEISKKYFIYINLSHYKEINFI